MLLKDSPYLPRGECRVVDAVLNGDVASGRGTVVLVQQEAEQVLQHNAGPRTYLYRTSRQCHAQRGSDAGRSDSEEEEEGWRCPHTLAGRGGGATQPEVIRAIHRKGGLYLLHGL